MRDAGAVELGVVDEIRAIDHRQEVVPLLRGEGRQPDKAVLAGFDARNHFDRRPPADAPGNRSGHRRVAHERHRERFEGRHIDQLAVARPIEAGTRRQGARCAVGAGDPFAEAAADGQRLATPANRGCATSRTGPGGGSRSPTVRYAGP